MENDAFADVKVEGTNPFDQLDTETTTSPESQTETKSEIKEPELGVNTTSQPEEDTKFHRRWADRESKLRSELESKFQQDLQAYKQEVEQKFTTFKPRDENSEIPEWFSTLYGENSEAWKKYSEYDQKLREDIRKDVIETQEKRVKQQEEETKKWEKWVDSGFSGLEAKGYKFDRNELAKVMLDYRPTDMNNNLDFEAGFKILDAIKPKDSNESVKARKQIADTVTRSTRGEPSKRDYQTSHTLKNFKL